MHYLVSLFTRPTSYANFFPSVASFSDGKDYIRHWGILVSQMTMTDLEVIFSRTREFGTNDNTLLGIMYELNRQENNKNTVSINTKFGMNSLRENWPMFSMEYVGKTEMTHEEIKQKGTICHPSSTES